MWLLAILVPMEKEFIKLWIQGRNSSKVKAKGKYDKLRVHLMEDNSLPDGTCNRLDVSDRLEWMCFPELVAPF